MASLAFIDKEKTQKKYARDCTHADKCKDFYCQTPNCPAIVRIRALDSVVRPPYFREKSDEFKHSEYCHPPKLNAFTPSEYDEDAFVFDDEMEKLFNLQQNSTPKKGNHQYRNGICNRRFLSGLLNIYNMCRETDVDGMYNNYEVKKMLCDCRSNFFYKNGIYGKKIVECRYLENNDEKRSIFFQYPIDPTYKNQHGIKAFFEDRELYKLIKAMVIDRGNLPIVIAGDWGKDKFIEDLFYCRIKNKRQIQLPSV